MCQTQPVPGYRTYLERGADTGASCWIDGVTSGAFPIEWVEQSRFGSDSALGVFRQLWYNPEAVTKRIQSHHPQLLGRSANGGEVKHWYGREVASDATVAAQIGSSAEHASAKR